MQTFIRFLFSQLNKEIVEMNSRYGSISITNIIDEIFGFSVKSYTTFLQSGYIDIASSSIRTFSIDLLYPSSVPKGFKLLESQEHSEFCSFATVLWGSFQKEIFMKGWCSMSESYEPFKQIRSLVSLPKLLTLLCGDTKKDIKDSTLACAMGEKTIIPGNAHAKFWSTRRKVSESMSPSNREESIESWIPFEIEVSFVVCDNINTEVKANQSNKLVISCQLKLSNSDEKIWVICDGKSEILSSSSFSNILCFKDNNYYDSDGLIWQVEKFELMSLLSQIIGLPNESDSNGNLESDTSQIVLHIKNTTSDGNDEWLLFNDFIIQSSDEKDVVDFPNYRHPCVLIYKNKDRMIISPPLIKSEDKQVTNICIPDSVLNLPSLSQVPCIR